MCKDGIGAAPTSRVGIMSSLRFTDIVTAFLHPNLTFHFRILLKTASILYCRQQNPSEEYQPYDMFRMRSYHGTLVMQLLETVLKPSALAAASLPTLQSLFLILMGTLLAVGYSSPWVSLQAFECLRRAHVDVANELIRLVQSNSLKSVFETAQGQLLAILAHYMIMVADRVDLVEEQDSRELVIQKATYRWERQASYVWSEETLLRADASYCNCQCLGAHSKTTDEQVCKGTGLWSDLPFLPTQDAFEVLQTCTSPSSYGEVSSKLYDINGGELDFQSYLKDSLPTSPCQSPVLAEGAPRISTPISNSEVGLLQDLPHFECYYGGHNG